MSSFSHPSVNYLYKYPSSLIQKIPAASWRSAENLKLWEVALITVLLKVITIYSNQLSSNCTGNISSLKALGRTESHTTYVIKNYNKIMERRNFTSGELVLPLWDLWSPKKGFSRVIPTSKRFRWPYYSVQGQSYHPFISKWEDISHQNLSLQFWKLLL